MRNFHISLLVALLVLVFSIFFVSYNRNALWNVPVEFRSQLIPLLNDTYNQSNCVVTSIPEEITRSWMKDRRPLAIVIENVLSKEECDSWIVSSESMGYEVALVTVSGGRQILIPDYRKSARRIVDDTYQSRILYDRIKGFLQGIVIEEMIPYELNERLRFLRYDVGEYFAPHMDGYYDRPDNHPRAGDYSQITFLLYLNDGFTGGATRFHHAHNNSLYFDATPTAGSVVLFEHRLNHSGEIVMEGRKYVVRSDILFTELK